ncbi:ribonuclease P protein component [Paraflavitalea soli]|uniref:Ribonuclease P protein component n=1 Tax=Paraflavitalea soli TaxID=2315862 RepID=A0A3B7N050_9BACT|nr:ribonuclease P protein component [Paraflavitalea soli]AXY78726.1 ribonuclease P protein component [Paraflavitalea soli]
MVKKLTLGKEERLKSRKLIDQLFKEGRSFTVFPFRVYYLFPPAQAPRSNHALLQFGVGVSTRNFKHAVDRNRVKRLIREAYRLQKTPFQELVQSRRSPVAVFVIYTGKELPTYAVVSEKIAVILKRLIKTADEIPPSVA